MQNRESIHPGRVRLIPVDVEKGIYDMVMADEPTQVGTPLRKETLLSDEAAADVKGYAAQAGIIGIDGEEFTEDMDLTVSQAIDALAIAGHVYGESTDQNADAIDMIHNDSGFGLPSKLDLTGGTMKGNLSMGGASITNLKTPSATTDAVNKGYVDTQIANNPGPKGDKGDTGPQGPAGAKGATGATGPKGDPGTYYGTCATAGATAAKVATVSGFSGLTTGAVVVVKFTNTNTASSPTMNVNNTGAKPIVQGSSTTIRAEQIYAGGSYPFCYDGTSWVLLSGYYATVNRYGPTILSNSLTSATSTAAATANVAKQLNDKITSLTHKILPVQLTLKFPSTQTINAHTESNISNTSVTVLSLSRDAVADGVYDFIIGSTNPAGVYSHDLYFQNKSVTDAVFDSNIFARVYNARSSSVSLTNLILSAVAICR